MTAATPRWDWLAHCRKDEGLPMVGTDVISAADDSSRAGAPANLKPQCRQLSPGSGFAV